MKQYKSRLLTAGLAAAIIAANAVGVAFAFQGDNSVPSYQSTLPTATASVQPSATVSPKTRRNYPRIPLYPLPKRHYALPLIYR